MIVKPEDVGLCSTRLSHIDRYLNKNCIESKKIAGAVTMIMRHGRIAHFSKLGMMDLERRKPMAEDTIFRIYSMTKPITSVAMMTLCEQGKCELSDAVHKFIPQWENLRVFKSGSHPMFVTEPLKRPMIIRDLMTHTSGLTYAFMEATNVDAAYRKLNIGILGGGGTLREMIEKLSEIPLEFSPGDHWNYSVSTDVLGYLIELMSGLPLDEYLKSKIFDPLRMVDTDFYVPPEKICRFAANYSWLPDNSLSLEDDPLRSRYAKRPRLLSGGSGLVSTASDYCRFCRMMLNGGELEGVRILDSKTVELMTINQLPGGQSLAKLSISPLSEVLVDGFGFGLGFTIHIDPEKSRIMGSPGEYSWGGAASTTFWIDPLKDLIVIFMTQFMPEGLLDFRNQLRAIIYPAIIE
jgi:CubicO group peptidase (beta-lactamase class C family)